MSAFDDDLPITPQQFSALIERIYQSAVDPSHWQLFIEELSSATGGQKCQMFGFDVLKNNTGDFVLTGYDEHFIQQYNEHYHARNFWAESISKVEAGNVVDIEAFVDHDRLLQTSFYNDWVLKQEDMLKTAGAVVFNDKSRALYLGCNYRSRDHEDLKIRWMNLARLLMPHLRQAYSLAAHLAETNIWEQSCNFSFANRQSTAILVVDESARIQFANSLAQQFLSIGSFCGTAIGGKLVFEDMAAENALLLAIGNLRNRRPVLASTVLVRDSEFGAKEVTIGELAPFDAGFPAMPKFSRPLIFVTIANQRHNDESLASLKSVLGLTNAEAEIVLGVFNGLKLHDIAQTRSASEKTVKNQLQTAMVKAGVKSKVELVIMLRRLLR